MRQYKQLTLVKRYQMEAIFTTQPEMTQKELAQQLGVHPSTVSRELKRYRVLNASKAYGANLAQQQSDARRSAAQKFTKYSERLFDFVVKQMERGWSPEQICGFSSAAPAAESASAMKRFISGYLKINASVVVATPT